MLNKITFAFIILSFALATQGFAQKEKGKNKKVNFGHSTNPPSKKSKQKEVKSENSPKTDASNTVSDSKTSKNKTNTEKTKKTENDPEIITVDATTAENTETENNETIKVKNVSIANKTREVAKKANKANLSPTEYYKVGIGDVLYINLQNTTAKYYTVLIDGTIDYPLAGKLVSVIDLTTEEIEDLLREKVKLYENPQVTVKVREYISHSFKVAGLARVGQHFLQREAMPLVVIKTMVGVKANAKEVTIERENEDSKTIALNSDEINTFLVQSGDKLTFSKVVNSSNNNNADSTTQYYFLGEKICDGGKKKFHSGITLVQAVFNACGGMNTKLKDVTIIRKTKSGKYISIGYNFKDILNGKEKDPILQVNDLIDAEK